MRLVHLGLTHFRNFTSLQIEVPTGPTLLIGSNAQGKTSLLEAVYYLVGGASPHTANDRQLIQLGTEPPIARLVAEIERASRTERIEIRLILEASPNGEGRLRKEVLLNGVKRRAAALHGRFHAVLFLPQDVELLEGAPAGRREQLDATLSQAEPRYAAALSEYAKVLAQRNALLKQLQDRRGTTQQLDYWDAKLVELGGEIMRRRAEALHELDRLAGPIHAALTGQAESLRIDYQPSTLPAVAPPEGSWSAEALRQGLTSELARLRAQELDRGTTLVGPQRDDVLFRANGIDLRLYGSRGQNRTAMLSLKLAEAEWLHHRTGERPVLLLDEVLAELDPQRRSDLLARLLDAPQALLTAADVRMFGEEFLGRSTVWTIERGSLSPGWGVWQQSPAAAGT